MLIAREGRQPSFAAKSDVQVLGTQNASPAPRETVDEALLAKVRAIQARVS